MRSHLLHLKNLFDPFILTLIFIFIAGILIPVPNEFIALLKIAGHVAVVCLFFVYGARLSTTEVIDGLKNWKLQLSVFLSTFIVFPLVGIVFHPLWTYLLGGVFAMGTLYVTLLPSTVQSSVSFTSIAGGNVAGAVCAATVSNTAGVVLTPLLVFLVMGRASGIDLSTMTNVLLELLLPFIIGQFFQPYIGRWLRTHRWLTKTVDQGTIVIVVTSAVCGATAMNLWDKVSVVQALLLVLSSAVVLAVMLALTWMGGVVNKLSYEDKIALLMCGSKKSLATGLPMASIIFPIETVAAVTVPIIIFHQFQLMVCAFIARSMARRPQ
ncbi:MAG: bile acid:sodium symporter family protein [Actinomycetaceae bacterium]|nr:bile acid:sodium symporter family protein [Actinomycetaceae bacterium]